MKKIAIIKDGVVQRVVVCKDESDITLLDGETKKECVGKVRAGTVVIHPAVGSMIKRKSLKDKVVWFFLGASTSAAGSLLHYFL